MDITLGEEARLQPWLEVAATRITVVPMDRGDWFRAKEWWVEVHNGLEGDDHAGTIIARCPSEMEAELVAIALLAYARRRFP